MRAVPSPSKIPLRKAPSHWADGCTTSECSFHQLAPYIGKLKSRIAGELIREHTSSEALIIDPFCGSGTIPLEASVMGRRVLAADPNPYAFVLTRAKLFAPPSIDHAIARFNLRFEDSRRRVSPDLRKVPGWVRSFFHPKTLKECINFANECLESRDHFLLACFLGILHHQRPGFLSYPSSHLVPYLRTNNFPRHIYPEMYHYRDLPTRMIAKITRAFKRRGSRGQLEKQVRMVDVAHFGMPEGVDAIITSPPYMNALDYRRDNRLRLWFIDRTVANYAPEPTDRRDNFIRTITCLARKSDRALRPRGKLILVVGDLVERKQMRANPSSVALEIIRNTAPRLVLRDMLEDTIPDIRRSRRDCRGAKKEKILILQKQP